MRMIQLNPTCQIRYSRLWDGNSAELFPPGILAFRDGHIADTPSPSAPLIDLSAYILMPALTDCHIHLALPYDGNDTPAMRAAQLLKSGIIAARDGGSRFPLPTTSSPPYISHSLHAITKAGFYGQNLGQSANNATEAKSLISRLAASGAGHIKLIASGIFSFSTYGETGLLPFSAEELVDLTRHSHHLGLSVMAHASGDDAVRLCIEAGVDSVEHGYFMSRNSVKQLAAAQIPWVPTLSPVAAQLENPALCRALSPAQRDVVHRSLERHKEMVGIGHSLGVPIGAGTDAGAQGVPHGPSLSREIALLLESGLPPAAALKAATATAAKICGFSTLGTITPGKKAALLAVEKNPLLYPETLTAPVALLLPS